MMYRAEGAMLAEEDGFSLVEMIVVVAILSMTAMIAFLDFRQRNVQNLRPPWRAMSPT